jgi:mRNA interferase RelE/StbE
MKINFKKSFLKELNRLNDNQLKQKIVDCILQVEVAQNLAEIKNIKKLKGFESYFRIRINDYRIGINIENDTVNFVVFEHRKDIYKTFP